MNKAAGFYIIQCRWCHKDHPYFGEDALLCSCGAVTRVIEIDDGKGHTKYLTYSPEKSREIAQKGYREFHWMDDKAAG